jgi:hypothetical protein
VATVVVEAARGHLAIGRRVTPSSPAKPVAGGHGETADALLHDIDDDRS